MAVILLAAVMLTALALVSVLALRICNLAEAVCDLAREALGEPEEDCLMCELEDEEAEDA